MFDVYCAGHESKVLLTIRQIERFENGPEGITVDWRCWCGTTGRLVRGQPAPSPVRSGRSVAPAVAEAAPATSPAA